MRIDTQQVLTAYIKYRLEAGLSAPLAINFPKLEEVLRKTFESIQLSVELPDGKTVPMNKEEPAQDGDLRLHKGEEQVYSVDGTHWVKHDNPEWIAMRKAFEHQKEEPIITVAEAFKKAGMKDLTPDQIKEMAETPLETPTEEVLKTLVAGDWMRYGEVGEDIKKVIAVDDTVLVAEPDPPECKRCNCEYLLDECYAPYDHGFCDPCASKELEELQEQLSIKMSNLDWPGEEFKPFLDEERLVVIQDAWYDMRNDSERQHHGWMVRMNETVNSRNEQLKELTKGRYKLIKQVSELKRGVAYVAMMKRIDELEIELLEYKNLRDRMIDDKEQVRAETQGALTESGKQIDELECRVKNYRTRIENYDYSIEQKDSQIEELSLSLHDQKKSYLNDVLLLRASLESIGKQAGLQDMMTSEKLEQAVVQEFENLRRMQDSLKRSNGIAGSQLETSRREVKQLKLRIDNLQALIKFGQPCTHVFRRNESSPRGEWCSGCGAHERHHLHDEGPNRCPDTSELKDMIRTPGYGPVNEDPIIGPDLKPHDKMSRQQLLAEVKGLEALPCKAACKKCGEVFQLSANWWGRDFVCNNCV